MTGGLGYLYLGAWKKGLGLLACVLTLHAANFVCAEQDWKVVSMVLGPSIFVLQVMSALDAWRCARP